MRKLFAKGEELHRSLQQSSDSIFRDAHETAFASTRLRRRRAIENQQGLIQILLAKVEGIKLEREQMIRLTELKLELSRLIDEEGMLCFGGC